MSSIDPADLYMILNCLITIFKIHKCNIYPIKQLYFNDNGRRKCSKCQPSAAIHKLHRLENDKQCVQKS